MTRQRRSPDNHRHRGEYSDDRTCITEDSGTESEKPARVDTGRKAQNAAERAAAERDWPREARVVYNSKGGINKGGQSVAINNVLEDLIVVLQSDFAFVCAIDSAQSRFAHQQMSLVVIAKKLRYLNIGARAVDDRRFASKMLDVVSLHHQS